MAYGRLRLQSALELGKWEIDARTMIEELEKPTPIIRKALRTMEFSRHVEYEPNESMREKWIQSEIFQVLRLGFNSTGHTRYGVRLEGQYARGRVDILIVNESQDQKYVIEVKRAAEREALDELPRQLRNAKEALRPTRTFAFIFAEREQDLPENNNKLQEVIDTLFANGLIDRENDLFVKGPDSVLRY